MNVLPARGWLLLVAALLSIAGWGNLPAHAQSGQILGPVCHCSPGSSDVPSKPGGGPDPYDKYKSDPVALRAVRDQARHDAQVRHEQVVEATALLLKISRELRAEMAASAAAMPTWTEQERLEQIQKLARIIQQREKSEDQAIADLTKAGLLP